ncbi:hypothetical protein J4409_01750 [Candidatus Woesearchaeota archaeon]|nr:hypothetical protein [Candidatus Woesearchaeota archaeon]
MFWWLKKRDYSDYGEKIGNINSSLHKSFSNVKTDITNLINMFNKLNENHDVKDKKIAIIEKRIDDLEGVFSDMLVNFKQNTAIGHMFEQPFGHKQTDVRLKQNVMIVQTDRLGDKWTKNLTPMERVIMNILLNTNIKLSYEDLSVMIGRDSSTIRGQMNNIKQKNESLVCEYIERTGKKRFFIDEQRKNEILKERAILVKRAKNESSFE